MRALVCPRETVASCHAAVARLSSAWASARSALAASSWSFVPASAGERPRAPTASVSATRDRVQRAVVLASLTFAAASQTAGELTEMPGQEANRGIFEAQPSGLTHRLDEDIGHLRPAELLRRPLTRPEHLADPRPREAHTVVLA